MQHHDGYKSDCCFYESFWVILPAHHLQCSRLMKWMSAVQWFGYQWTLSLGLLSPKSSRLSTHLQLLPFLPHHPLSLALIPYSFSLCNVHSGFKADSLSALDNLDHLSILSRGNSHLCGRAQSVSPPFSFLCPSLLSRYHSFLKPLFSPPFPIPLFPGSP